MGSIKGLLISELEPKLNQRFFIQRLVAIRVMELEATHILKRHLLRSDRPENFALSIGAPWGDLFGSWHV